jgi:hypothetical protein
MTTPTQKMAGRGDLSREGAQGDLLNYARKPSPGSQSEITALFRETSVALRPAR